MTKRSLIAFVSLVVPATITAQDPAPDSARIKVQKLETVQVEGKRSRSRYGDEYSRTATKTSALIRDVPQSITSINKTLVRDQAMKSMADVVRYVPGISMGQGEGNRD